MEPIKFTIILRHSAKQHVHTNEHIIHTQQMEHLVAGALDSPIIGPSLTYRYDNHLKRIGTFNGLHNNWIYTTWKTPPGNANVTQYSFLTQDAPLAIKHG